MNQPQITRMTLARQHRYRDHDHWAPEARKPLRGGCAPILLKKKEVEQWFAQNDETRTLQR